jgi:ribonuclease Z
MGCLVDADRFIFDVGDGTQRMCMEHHIRLGKLRHVFLTELRTQTVGGLPGVCTQLLVHEVAHPAAK